MAFIKDFESVMLEINQKAVFCVIMALLWHSNYPWSNLSMLSVLTQSAFLSQKPGHSMHLMHNYRNFGKTHMHFLMFIQCDDILRSHLELKQFMHMCFVNETLHPLCKHFCWLYVLELEVLSTDFWDRTDMTRVFLK